MVRISITKNKMENTKMTDEKLFELCKRYGSEAQLWRRRFVGLLPEVNKRRLYLKKGFSSIFEFSAKLCGLSNDQVRLALNLEKRLEDKPVLKKMLEEGQVSINKLARVVSIATPINEEELAEKVKVLTKSALETFVRDEKYSVSQNQEGSRKPLFESKSLPGQTSVKQEFHLAPDVVSELNTLNSMGIDVNDFLRKALEQRKEEIAKDMQSTQPDGPKNATAASTRYIPAKVKKVLREEYGTKCSIPNCQKPAEVIHHTQRFGITHNNDPRFLAPLCYEHHEIAHAIDLKYQVMRKAGF